MIAFLFVLLPHLYAEPTEEALPPAVIQAAEAVRKMHFGKLNKETSQFNPLHECAGYSTSNQGHHLTNKHCLETCRKHTGQGRCEFVIGSQLIEPEIIYEPKCYGYLEASASSVQELSNLAKNLRDEAVAKDCTEGNDFVLLKLSLSASTCLKASTEAAKGEVFVLGFPSYKQSAKVIRTRTEQVFSVHGSVCQGLFETPAAKILYPHQTQSAHAIGDILGEYHVRQAQNDVVTLDQMSKYWRDSEVAIVAAMISPGHSGGPVVNSNGEFVGLTNATAGPPSSTPSGAGYFIPISHIKKKLQEEIGSEATAKAFDCK